ncbi:MAG: hypothetical protein M1816_006319 [Peltula sp. TS41687]|nr:MAG: hypothetical protein M1816_006319 [Peltula sp. TS41687]
MSGSNENSVRGGNGRPKPEPSSSARPLFRVRLINTNAFGATSVTGELRVRLINTIDSRAKFVTGEFRIRLINTNAFGATSVTGELRVRLTNTIDSRAKFVTGEFRVRLINTNAFGATSVTESDGGVPVVVTPAPLGGGGSRIRWAPLPTYACRHRRDWQPIEDPDQARRCPECQQQDEADEILWSIREYLEPNEARDTARNTYGCGHAVDPDGPWVFNAPYKKCRPCSFRKLWEDMCALRAKHGPRIWTLTSHLNISERRVLRAIGDGRFISAGALLHRRLDWLDELDRLMALPGRRKNLWWLRFGDPTDEETETWYRWRDELLQHDSEDEWTEDE